METMKQQIEHLDSTLSRRNASIKKLEDDLKLTNKKLVETEKLLTDQQQNNNNIESQKPMVNGSSEVSGVIIDPQILKVNEMSMTHLNKLLIAKDADIAKLKTDLEGLKAKNDILREEKYKVVESLKQMETNVKSLTEKSEVALKAEFSKIESDTKQKLNKLLPNCHLNEKSPLQKFIDDFSTKMQESSAKNDEVAILKSKNQVLKNALRDTEKILQKVQSSVENCGEEYERLKADTCNCLQEQLKCSAKVESQLQCLKEALEEEKKRQSDLMNDLRHKNDLLDKEKLLCKELSAQVSKWKGTVCENNSQNANVTREIEELRQKLQRKDELLEREIQINKQLNNKLTNLGAFTDK